jgi:hypothetical protein
MVANGLNAKLRVTKASPDGFTLPNGFERAYDMGGRDLPRTFR